MPIVVQKIGMHLSSAGLNNMKKLNFDPMEANDGNAFSILVAFKRHAKQNGWDKESIDNVIKEATSMDYDHLLQTLISQ